MTSSPAENNGHTGSICRWSAAGAAFVLPLVFALFTNHVWEDYYITFRASKNLAEGHGLVFQIGERVHSFTSPLGVLLPAFFSFVTPSDTAALWCFRVVCSGALAGTLLLLWKTLERAGASTATGWLLTLLLLSDSKTIDFTINGMETAFMLLFVAALLHELLRTPSPRGVALGSILAALMWTRPDAFVIATTVMLAAVIFQKSLRASPRGTLALALRAGVVTALLYGPWFAWAWWYYGSPVPHTILAKSGASPNLGGWHFLFSAPFHYMSGSSAMRFLANPSYYFFGGWPEFSIFIGKAIAVIAGFVWVVPSISRYARLASFALFLGSYYLQAIPTAPWYFPYWYLLAAVALAGLFSQWISWASTQRLHLPIARSLCAVVILVQFGVVAATSWQVRNQQEIIENSGRRLIGEWLRDHAQKNDTVFLEPLGYIGYFSQLHMLDYPGLSAPAVVEARKHGAPLVDQLVQRLKPDWLVVRIQERKIFGLLDQNKDDYEFVIARDGKPQLNEIAFLPGRGLLELDSTFLVYHRRSARSMP